MAKKYDPYNIHPNLRENWWSKNWRPMCAAVYLTICVFDFIVMPLWYEIENKKIDQAVVVELALKFQDPAIQGQVLDKLSTKRTWSPITLAATGLFHLAFGALLTGAAWTRGQERIASINSGLITPSMYGSMPLGGYNNYGNMGGYGGYNESYGTTTIDTMSMGSSSGSQGKPIIGSKPVTPTANPNITKAVDNPD